jgi:hypothetical protein
MHIHSCTVDPCGLLCGRLCACILAPCGQLLGSWAEQARGPRSHGALKGRRQFFFTFYHTLSSSRRSTRRCDSRAPQPTLRTATVRAPLDSDATFVGETTTAADEPSAGAAPLWSVDPTSFLQSLSGSFFVLDVLRILERAWLDCRLVS